MDGSADRRWVFEHFTEPRFNNDAGRLLELLNAIRIHPGSGEQLHVAWQEVLFRRAVPSDNIQDGHWLELLAAFVTLNQIVDEVEQDLREQFANEWDLYEKIFPKMRQLFAPKSPSESLGNHIGIIDQIIPVLGLCAKDLPKEGKLTNDELKELFVSVADLFDEIRNSSIAPQLKRWMLGLVAKLLDAINHYRIHGGRGLRKALAELLGELALNEDKIKSAKVPEPIKSKFWTVLAKSLDVCRQAVDKVEPVIKLVGWAAKLLEGEVPGLPEDEKVD